MWRWRIRFSDIWLLKWNLQGRILLERGLEGVEATYEMSVQRMADLERRVLALEERTRKVLWHDENGLSREEELAQQYGEYVDKTVAARILGVTRATIYAMLADGRIESACAGRRFSSVYLSLLVQF